MKTRSLFTIILICTVANLKAQNYKVNIENTAVFIQRTIRLTTSPSFEWTKGSNSYSIGPSFLMMTEIASSDKQFPKFVGFQMRFIKNFTTASEKLSFYFFNQFFAHRMVDRWRATVWNVNLEQYSNYNYENIEYLLQNHVGYGFNYKLGKHISITKSIGLGAYYSITDSGEREHGAPRVIKTGENLSGYSPFGFSWQAKFGLKWSL